MSDSSFEHITNFIRDLYSEKEGKISLHTPVFKGNESKYLEACLKSTFVSSVGKFVDEFEEALASYVGAKKAVACVNGTSALHVALRLLNVGEEDEIITQPLTFVATSNAINYCGAYPIYVDVDRDTVGMSPQSLQTWLEENTKFDYPSGLPVNKSTSRKIKACIPVHTYGHPCRIDEIVDICDRFNIPVVEDAAESLGSYYKGIHTGTTGKIGVFSFNGNKIITSGGGGMLVFNDDDLASRAKHLTRQAKMDHRWDYNHDEIGYNYRMPNLNAALGLAQLEKINTYIRIKRNIAERYRSFFNSNSFGVEFISEPSYSKSNYWLCSIIMNSLDERNRFLSYANDRGILVRPSWTLMTKLKMFRGSDRGPLWNSKHFESCLVNLPSSVFI